MRARKGPERGTGEGGIAVREAQEYAVFYRHFDLPANFPVIALLGDTWVSRPEPFHRIHFHNCLEIGYLYEGSGLFYIDGETVPVEAPCVTLIPQNVPHFSRGAGESLCHWNWLYVDPVQLLPDLNLQTANAMNRFFASLSADACVFPERRHPQVVALLRMVIREIGSGQPYRQDIARALFCALFFTLLRQGGPSSAEHPPRREMTSIEPAITHIADNYMNELSVAALAGLCHMSLSHFRRRFKQVLGWAPQEYLQIIRVDRACAMLYNCDNSIAQIAESVGYPSTSSFNRQFKRLYGMSPRQWRQKIRGEENPVVTAYFNALPPTTMQFFPKEYDNLRKSPDEG